MVAGDLHLYFPQQRGLAAVDRAVLLRRSCVHKRWPLLTPCPTEGRLSPSLCVPVLLVPGYLSPFRRYKYSLPRLNSSCRSSSRVTRNHEPTRTEPSRARSKGLCIYLSSTQHDPASGGLYRANDNSRPPPFRLTHTHNYLPPLLRPTARAMSPRASELEVDIKTVKGGDEAAALRRLEDGLNRLKADFREVHGLAQGAQEAADKCQVEKTEEMTAKATAKATVFEGQARAVVNGAKSAAQVSTNQKNAFEKAKAAAPAVLAAGEKAAASFRLVSLLLGCFVLVLSGILVLLEFGVRGLEFGVWWSLCPGDCAAAAGTCGERKAGGPGSPPPSRALLFY